MPNLYFAIFLVTIVCSITSIVSEIVFTTDPIPTPFFNYGGIIFSHNIELPNYDQSGFHHYYVITNLPAQRTEIIYDFAALFTVLNGSPDTPSDLTLHIVRPRDGVVNGLTFIKSATISGFVSGIKKNVYSAGLTLEAGDFLVLSVPADGVRLRVGPNNIGYPLQYGIIEIGSGTQALQVQAENLLYQTIYTLSPLPTGEHALPEGQFLQICAAYGTFGPKNQMALNSEISMFAGGPNQVIVAADNDKAVSEFIVGVVNDVNQLYVGKVLVEVQVAKPCFVGLWCVNEASLVTNYQYLVDAGQTYVTNKELVVQTGDRVGIRLVDTGLYPILELRIAFTNAFAPTPQPFYDWYTMPRNAIDGVLVQNYQSTDTPSFQFDVKERGDSTINGDPQFSGFQGQSFQFHGLADEHFNLISTPSLQLNSHFVYLSSGKCDYNNTMCFQHPGTYVDTLGFIIPSIQGDIQIKLVSGTHQDGLRVWIGTAGNELHEIHLHQHRHGLTWLINNDTTSVATVTYNHFGEVTIDTPLFTIDVVNSDYFFNLGMSLKDRSILRIGSTRHTITDHSICDHDRIGYTQTIIDTTTTNHHNHGIIETELLRKYQNVHIPIHGLIGQTWRNVKVCGKDWIGAVQDYVTSDLFSSDYHFNHYSRAA